MRPEGEGAYRDGAGYILQGVNVYSGIALLREAEAVDTRFMGRKGFVARRGRYPRDS